MSKNRFQHNLLTIRPTTIVIHRADASRMACATLGSAKTAVATFSAASTAAGSVTGDIAFTQVEGGPAVVDPRRCEMRGRDGVSETTAVSWGALNQCHCTVELPTGRFGRLADELARERER